MFTHDRSLLNDIDPGINYIDSKCQLNSRYYTEEEFNDSLKFNDNFFILHLYIRSIPTHFNEIVSYLDTLNIDFKVITLSETWLTNNHNLYNLANYSVEFDYHPKRRGGGTSLYIHSCLQYKSRDDLKLYGDNSGDANSVFIEINKQTSKTKCNIIVGCIYRPHLDIFTRD